MLNLFQHLSSRRHCEERSDEAISFFHLSVILPALGLSGNLIQDLSVSSFSLCNLHFSFCILQCFFI